MVNRPKMQGTAFESWMVKWLNAIDELSSTARRIAEGGSNDEGDVEWEDHAGYNWIGECKATQTLNVTRVLGKARKKSKADHTVLFWKRLTKKKGDQLKRTPDGEPIVVVMALDTFKTLMEDR
jgi:hypothetical protein